MYVAPEGRQYVFRFIWNAYYRPAGATNIYTSWLQILSPRWGLRIILFGGGGGGGYFGVPTPKTIFNFF